VNSIADADDRKAHREKLIAYFERHAAILDEDAKRRLHANPLRILDSKNPAMQAMIDGAPMLVDGLGEGARRHFGELQRLLDLAGVAYRVNPRIVRGLDYYNRTVFEFISPDVGAQSTIAGGGRYDALFEQLGGKRTPACGFAVGIERVLLAMQSAGAKAAADVDVFVAHSGESASAVAFRVAEDLRDHGSAVLLGGGGSFKSQMKKADAANARFAVIIGEDEVASGKLTLKNLRDGSQQVVTKETLINLGKS
jgi:histidyl-tRNA synthetase